MITFLVCVAILVVGYFTYGKIVNKIVVDGNVEVTPAHRRRDGVDFVPMHWGKVLLIQFLNIAGTGPIFGAIAGALFGPVAFLWITFGTLFAGGVHDILCGYISMKHDGTSVSEMAGIYLGDKVKHFMRFFSVILLILVGAVFITSPAGLLANLTGLSIPIWTGIIIAYYLVATILPVDKVIGKIYPLFGFAMLFMAVGLGVAMVVGHLNGSLNMVELNFSHIHPSELIPFPFLFVTIACGAISGFHATQSPMMSRCLNKEGETKRIFYGAMVIEGIVALVWCAVTIAVFGSSFNLSGMGGPAVVVNEISSSLLGPIGMVLAVLGVVAAPITSGDTAFRSARLIIADALKLDQGGIAKRFLIALPLFAIGTALTFMDFNIIWRYFAWANQTMAMIMLWPGAAWLYVHKKNPWIAAIPATFMVYVVVGYIIQAPEGFQLPAMVGNITGVIAAAASLVFFYTHTHKNAQITYEIHQKDPEYFASVKLLKKQM
ncbi:MAG: carbon starvation protein A [Turicibacter sp.]|nr:carbon starvation protein A [Turicibacter sp.]